MHFNELEYWVKLFNAKSGSLKVPKDQLIQLTIEKIEKLLPEGFTNIGFIALLKSDLCESIEDKMQALCKGLEGPLSEFVGGAIAHLKRKHPDNSTLLGIEFRYCLMIEDVEKAEKIYLHLLESKQDSTTYNHLQRGFKDHYTLEAAAKHIIDVAKAAQEHGLNYPAVYMNAGIALSHLKLDSKALKWLKIARSSYFKKMIAEHEQIDNSDVDVIICLKDEIAKICNNNKGLTDDKLFPPAFSIN